jgi:hypothetical protein
MTVSTKAVKNLASLIFGIVLSIMGLVASLYPVTQNNYQGINYVNNVSTYPYQTVGIVLIVIGLIFVGLGLFYSPPKTD